MAAMYGSYFKINLAFLETEHAEGSSEPLHVDEIQCFQECALKADYRCQILHHAACLGLDDILFIESKEGKVPTEKSYILLQNIPRNGSAQLSFCA